VKISGLRWLSRGKLRKKIHSLLHGQSCVMKIGIMGLSSVVKPEKAAIYFIREI